MYQKYLDPIIEEFTTGENYAEVFRAKEEYFERAGVVYDDDEEFEQRMTTFMDWYIFERDLPGVDLPPIRLYFRRNQESFKPEDLGIYRDFCSTIHSIFRLKRFRFFGKGFVIQDLFSRKSYTVVDSEIHQGFARGDVFEARLIPFRDTYEFSRGFCFHPKEVGNFILSEIKKVRYQEKSRQNKLILQLSAMKLKQLRFKHIDMKHIYTMDSRF